MVAVVLSENIKANWLVVRSLQLFIIISSFFSLGCDVKRPPGFLTIGKVSEVASKTSYLADKNFYLVRDAQGLSIISTLCSYGRLPLKLINENGREFFVSDYNPSRYDVSGHVLSGPAKHDLLFYALRVDSGVYGGPKDTLYVQIGNEVPREWRLKIEG